LNDLHIRGKIAVKIRDLTEYLVKSQGADGAWHYCFENGMLTDAYMIILLRLLNINDETYINALAQRIASRQETSGAWKLFYDEPEGNLSATIESYYALLAAGYRKKDSPEMVRAREFILSKGGPEKAGSLTKVMLALTGHYPWGNFPDIPVEIVLLPAWAPVNFFDFVGYTRVHAAPILLCADKKYALIIPGGPELSDLFPSSPRQLQPRKTPWDLQNMIEKTKRNIPLSRNKTHDLAVKKLERFMLSRIEWDGTLYSYFTSTFLMVFALLALGYGTDHPVVMRAVTGLKAMSCSTGTHTHQQETTSTIWDTALITYALREAGLSHTHPAVAKAASYLWAKQQTKYGDWQVHNPQGRPGGWGFSHSNTINPDVDDTSYALRAVYRHAAGRSNIYGSSWRAGLEWLLTMQNDDGGWPAFERNTDKKWLEYLPIPDAKPVWTDPSSADLTGRTLEFLGNYAGMSVQQPHVQKGVAWLLNNQGPDGSWYGRWGISYIYGTWAAVTGLIAVKTDPHQHAVEKAVNWLLSIQNPDGGWGESCLSDESKQYIPLGFSTPSQTAWALDALIAAGLQENPAVTRGVESLLKLVEKNGTETSYPTGAGLPGGFYIHYHSYRCVWPLLALSHYLKR